MNDALEEYFRSASHLEERSSLPLLRELTERYANEMPLEGSTVVFGHVLARNSMVMVEVLRRGGARVILTDAHDSPAAKPVIKDLDKLAIPRYSVSQGVSLGDIYLDVAAILARQQAPRMAAEVTRSGTETYESLGIPVINADLSRCKLIEGFFGTGEAFLRAWRQLRPQDPLLRKRMALIGYGKIGRGVGFRARQAGLRVTVLDRSVQAVARARSDGFKSLLASETPQVETTLRNAAIIVSVTGVKGAVGTSFPREWFDSGAVLVNLGAEDEFGPGFHESDVLGGKSFPLNFHLEQPTLNRYVDAPLAAHILALEALLQHPARYGPGVHPLPPEHDRWVVQRWRAHHPDEDLTGIQSDLGL